MKNQNPLGQLLFLIVLLIIGFLLLKGPESIAKINESKAVLAEAEGNRELHFAAADAIRANAEMVRDVGNVMTLFSGVAALLPFVFVGVAMLVFFGIRAAKRNDESGY